MRLELLVGPAGQVDGIQGLGLEPRDVHEARDRFEEGDEPEENQGELADQLPEDDSAAAVEASTGPVRGQLGSGKGTGTTSSVGGRAHGARIVET
ncbi:MAG: hypothetical protein ACJAZN_000984 [Planctomycetota bacterium]